jgi:nicotinamidase-related amidase
LLLNTGITTVVVIGVSLNIAIPSLVVDALNRSYQVVVVSDAVVGVPIDLEKQGIEHSLAIVATVVTTDELIAAWDGE